MYPDGRTIWYGYDAGLDNAVSRVSWIADGSTTAPGQHLETYQYLGVGTVIGRSLPEPGISETTSLDNFGRVAGVDWAQSSTSGTSDLDHHTFGYDADVASRRMRSMRLLVRPSATTK